MSAHQPHHQPPDAPVRAPSRLALLAALCLVGLVGLIGCGPDTDEDTPDNKQDPRAAFLFARDRLLVEQLCAVPDRCPHRVYVLNALETTRYADATLCAMKMFQQRLDAPDHPRKLPGGLDALTLNASAATACLAALRATDPCAQDPAEVLDGLTCRRALTGPLGEGDICQRDETCAEGRACVRPSLACAGVCTFGGLLGDGHKCTRDTCPRGTNCVIRHDTQLCLPARREGEPCTRNTTCEEGTSCVTSHQTGAGTCQRPFTLPLGAACSRYYNTPDHELDRSHCVRGARCDVETQRCVPINTDETCTWWGGCEEGAACYRDEDDPDAPGRCDTPGLRPLGGTCTHPSQCQEGLSCAPFERRCVRPASPGEPCPINTFPPCTSGASCLDDVCVVHHTQGEDEECSEHEQCAEPLVCRRERCQERATQGGSCSEDQECAEGLWCLATSDEPGGRKGACSARGIRGEGEYCEQDEWCAPTLRCAPDRQCAPRVKEGEVCGHAWSSCAEGLKCGDSLPREERRCEPLPYTKEEGESCRQARQDCARELMCSDGVCVRRLSAPKRLGEWCSSFSEDLCQRGLTCDLLGYCSPPAQEGERCVHEHTCAPGLVCAQRGTGYLAPFLCERAITTYTEPERRMVWTRRYRLHEVTFNPNQCSGDGPHRGVEATALIP